MILAQAPSIDKPSIQALKERHYEMMRRLVAGDMAVDICKAMGVTQAWFSIVQASPAFQAELIKLRAEADKNAADVGARLEALAPDAMGVIEDAIRKQGKESPLTPLQRVYIAQDVLDRTDHGKSQPKQKDAASVKVEIVQFGGAQAQVNVIAPTKLED